MSDKRKSDYECEMCKRVMHIGPCPHNRGILDELALQAVDRLLKMTDEEFQAALDAHKETGLGKIFVDANPVFTHDECQARYEALLQEALKLEAALELALSFAPKGPVPKDLPPMFYHTLSYEEEVKLQVRVDEAREALAQFKKWRGGE